MGSVGKYLFISVLAVGALGVSYFYFISQERNSAHDVNTTLLEKDTASREEEQKAASFARREAATQGNEDTADVAEEKDVLITMDELLSSDEIRDSIQRGVVWLKRSQEANGHFRYEYVPLADTYSDEDLMVRQTGAFYMLGEVLTKDPEDSFEVFENIERAIAFFEQNSVNGTMNNKEFRCLRRNEIKCSLGGTALTMVGILDLLYVYPELEMQYQLLLNDYLRYLLASKKQNEGFRGYYYFDGEQTETESDFSNGEAFLALVRYYEYRPTDEVKEVIDDAFIYFNEFYRAQWNYNFYLWGMSALKSLYALDPQTKYYDFAKAFTDWRMAGYALQHSTTDNRCAYIEGVISAYSVISPRLTDQEKSVYLEEINFWLTQSKKLQVDESGSLTLQFGSATYHFELPAPEQATGGFLTGLSKPFQRIDFTQHCVSSYLQTLTDIRGEGL